MTKANDVERNCAAIIIFAIAGIDIIGISAEESAAGRSCYANKPLAPSTTVIT